MAPEQARSAGDLDGRADLWSFGALLYECLTGSLPYDGATIPELLVRSATQSPTPLRALRPEVPEALAAVIHRALERNRALRYPCARALREALERALAYPEDLSPRTLSVPPAARTTPLRRYLLAAAGALGLLVNTMPSRAMHTPSYNDAPSSFPPPAPLDRDPALRAFAQSPLRVRVRTPARRGSTPAPVRLCIGQ
jgi:serine/threonine-protein kinase